MIEPTTDAARVNAIVNHPGVRPWVADLGEGEIDLSGLLGKPNTLCLAGEHGVFLVIKYGDGIWECHTAVLPEGRGAWARGFAEELVRYMFTATDCVDLITRVPQGHVAAKTLTEAMGFRWQFDTPPECLFRGEMVPVHIYTLTLQEWSVRASWVEEEGAEFHQWLNRQVDEGTPHETDPGHNRTVGIALAMMRAGMVAKGVVWYNRAALAARHKTIALVGLDPPQVRFDAGILTMSGGKLHYEPCH